VNTAWPAVPLEAVCDRITVGHVGPMASEYVDDGIPFLRSQNIGPFVIDVEDLKFISPSFHRKLKKCALSAGDVVIVRTGYPGTAAVVPASLGEANCADLVVITPGPALNAYFLAAIFNSTWGADSVKGRLVGSAQQHFNIGAARRMEIRLPPPIVQRKIASVLSAYDDLIENNNRRIRVLEEMVQRIYREWFVDFRYPQHENEGLVESRSGPIPDAWEIVSLEEIVDDVRNGIPASDATRSRPYVPIDCISSQSLVLTQWKPGDLAASSLVSFRRGDVLFGAMRPYFHKVVLAPFDGTTRTTCFVLRAKEQFAYGYSVMTLFEEETVAFATAHASGTTIPYARWSGALGTKPTLWPDRGTLRRFDDAVGPILSWLMDAGLRIANLRETRDLLLPRLISGQIDVAGLDIAVNQDAA
jgi:type I restriction enzyme S subunit